jgi:hypothetical protein
LRGGIEDLTPLAILSPKPSALLPDLPVAAAIVPESCLGFARTDAKTLLGHQRGAHALCWVLCVRD